MTEDSNDGREAGRNKVAAICRRLGRVYGPVEPPRERAVLDSLVATILSQNTSDSNSHAAFASIRSAAPFCYPRTVLMPSPTNLPTSPQLAMRRPDLDRLPEVQLPAGYTIRSFRPGDGPAWGRVISDAFGREHDATQFDRVMRPHFAFRPERVLFVAYGEELVATASCAPVAPCSVVARDARRLCALLQTLHPSETHSKFSASKKMESAAMAAPQDRRTTQTDSNEDSDILK